MKTTTLDRLLQCRIVAVIRSVKGERLISMGEAFLLGGIDCVEIDDYRNFPDRVAFLLK